ncbi:hypothetical protein ACHAXR_008691, partial [Thalassiosira sp. AJA248-18]
CVASGSASSTNSSGISSETTSAAQNLNLLARSLQEEVGGGGTKKDTTADAAANKGATTTAGHKDAAGSGGISPPDGVNEAKQVNNNQQATTTTSAADVVIKVSQSLPSSNASSSEEDDNNADDVRTSNVQSQQKSNSPSSSPSNNTNYNPLPMKRSTSGSADAASVYDDEYARFMRSIIGDDQSVLTFKTLQSIRSRNGTGGGGSIMMGSQIGSAFETLDEDDISYQLTSDEEDDDDDDEMDLDDEEEGGGDESMTTNPTMHTSPQKRSAASASAAALPPTTPMTILPHHHHHSEETNDEDLLNVLGEIEGLMEEDLEAAVMASLIGGPSAGGEGELSGSGWQNNTGAFGSGGGGGGGGGPGSNNKASNKGAIMGSQQQKDITTPGQSTKKKKSTTTVVTTPSPCMMGRDRNKASSAAAAAAGAGANSTPALEVPAVSKDQLARLRGIMARHHQLLLQQATLSVRAAYVQKVRKDGVSGASPQHTSPMSNNMPVRGSSKKMNTSLPESRLDTRSLTFCSRPTDSKCSYVNDFFGGETPEELSECLDGAVGMLQDLEQNWKDAVRNSIQLSFQPSAMASQQAQSQQSGRRNLNFGDSASTSHHPPSSNNGSPPADSTVDMRLTRSAFTKTLLERELEMGNNSCSSSSSHYYPNNAMAQHNNDNLQSSPEKQHQQYHNQNGNGRISVFEVRGLARLKETFSALDNSVKDIQMGREKGKNKDGINILAPDQYDEEKMYLVFSIHTSRLLTAPSHFTLCFSLLIYQHGKACEILLKHARAEIDPECVPGGISDLGKCLTHAPEAYDEPLKVGHPLTKKQEAELRRNRHTFTAGEDNLILRGVNLYGEKEWCLVSDRFLPDRVVNSISQRYNKLCFMIYRANGIHIDDKGKLPPIPTFAKGAMYDVAKVNQIRSTRAPTTMNVHRWTLEEDIAILKAVPVMGNAWAEICTKLMPHRDRGHIRKRFQVLQRRIPKGVTKMNSKYLLKRPPVQAVKSPKPPKRARPPRSPAKKRGPTKKKASAKASKQILPAAAKSMVPAAQPVAPPPASPARIFEQAARVLRQPPISPIKSAPERPSLSPRLATTSHGSSPSKVRPFSNHGSRALAAAIQSEVERQNAGDTEPSPETRVVASVLGGFSQSSRLDFPPPSREQEENTQMGVEKILGNDDDWSQASGMQRLIEAGTAESNFMHEHHHHVGEGAVPPQSPTKMSELPMYQVHGGEASGLSVINGDHHHADEATQGQSSSSHHGGPRKSILSSVMEKTKENELKRKSSTAFPSTPQKVGFRSYMDSSASPSQENVLPAQEAGYPSSIPTSAMSFNLGTPAKEEGLGMGGVSAAAEKGELSMNHDLFEYFMSEKSRTTAVSTPGRTGANINSPSKTGMMMSPIKIGNLGPSTPLSQFGALVGGISAPLGDGGCNSLLMGASDFDAVAALKDLSNSAPNTPSKLIRPRDETRDQEEAALPPYNQDDAADEGGEEEKQVRNSRKKPRTSFFGQVKAKVEERKTG